MNKYKIYTDKQINNAVAHETGKKFVTIIGDDVRISGYNFDPCNNPADAIPIVIENGISLINDSGNDNIYRAAMEVFLMMKEAEK